MRKKFIKVVGQISIWNGRMCGPFYMIAILLSVFEVFMRYALDAPTSWTAEIIMMLVATAWLLCAGVVTQQHRHITVTTMEIIVGEKLWQRMKKVAISFSILAVIGLIYAGWKPMVDTIAKAWAGSIVTSGSAFNPPIPTYLKVMLVVAGILYLLQLIANFLDKEDEVVDNTIAEN